MATGLEMYDALKDATSHLEVGSEFTINAIDSYDLCKLTVSDLESRGYDRKVAEEVSGALLQNDFEPFGRSLGLTIHISPDAPRLIPGD